MIGIDCFIKCYAPNSPNSTNFSYKIKSWYVMITFDGAFSSISQFTINYPKAQTGTWFIFKIQYWSICIYINTRLWKFWVGNVYYYLQAGRSVLRKTVPEVLRKDRGQRQRSLHRPREQFFSIRTSRQTNNIFIFFFILFTFTETFNGFSCQEFAIICWRARW